MKKLSKSAALLLLPLAAVAANFPVGTHLVNRDIKIGIKAYSRSGN